MADDLSLSEEQLLELEENLKYKFKDRNFITHALTHSSVKDKGLASNERLEFLGDSILGYIVSEYLYLNFPNHQEGGLSAMKSILVSAKTLASRAKTLGLDKVVIVGRGLDKRKSLPRSILCDTFEAIVAAIYLDGGIEAVKEFILRNIQDKIHEIKDNLYEKNYKSLLQDYAQREFSTIPIYTVTKESGPDHRKMFQVIVEVNGKSYGPAWGMNKKEAEQGAAKLALQSLGIETNAETSSPC